MNDQTLPRVWACCTHCTTDICEAPHVTPCLCQVDNADLFDTPDDAAACCSTCGTAVPLEAATDVNPDRVNPLPEYVCATCMSKPRVYAECAPCRAGQHAECRRSWPDDTFMYVCGCDCPETRP